MQEVIQEFYNELDSIQRKIHRKELTDSVRDIYGHILQQDGSAPVHSDLILSAGSQDEGLKAAGLSSAIPQISLTSDELSPASLRYFLPYIHAPGSRVRMRYRQSIARIAQAFSHVATLCVWLLLQKVQQSAPKGCHALLANALIVSLLLACVLGACTCRMMSSLSQCGSSST
jgi:hypothetical protein